MVVSDGFERGIMARALAEFGKGSSGSTYKIQILSVKFPITNQFHLSIRVCQPNSGLPINNAEALANIVKCLRRSLTLVPLWRHL